MSGTEELILSMTNTEKIKELEQESNKLKEDIQWMVKKHADKNLPAYREQGEKMEALEQERDELKSGKSGLLHNMRVIESELKQIDERECSKSAWDRISLALEYAECQTG